MHRTIGMLYCLYFFFSLLDSALTGKCDRFKHAYANILFQWEQMKQRAELLGYLSSRAQDENSRFCKNSLILSYSINKISSGRIFKARIGYDLTDSQYF